MKNYESMSTNPKEYEGHKILILGRGISILNPSFGNIGLFSGNSAFETANNIYGSTAVVHMIGRSRARLAWSTHYVGDLR
jgi:hypothetical protein